MSIITITSDSHQKGREIAQKTAAALGYTYLGREILSKVAEKYHPPETKLTEAMDKIPYSFGMSTKIRNRYLAYIQEAVLGELLKDNVVCEGLAVHLYVLGVSHLLKIRILLDSELRAQELASHDGISLKKAKKRLNRQKKLRRQWSLDVFRFDETDSARYDLTISLSQIDSDEVVKIITETVGSRKFQPMTYSIQYLQDLELACRVRALLMGRFPISRVRADGGTLVVETTGLKREKRKREVAIKELAGNIPGVDYLEVHFINDFFRQAADSFR